MKSDVIIILGGGINPDGSLREITIDRIKKGIKLFRRNITDWIIASGAYGFMENYVPPITEAKAMAKYLENNGVPKEKIILEEKSKDTIGNAYFTKVNVLEPRKWYNPIVVTSNFHIPRTRYIFKKVLGKKYNVSFVKVTSKLPRDLLERIRIKEQKVLNLLKRWTKEIEDGDDKSLKKFLYTEHPAYAKHPEITREQLRRMIGSVSRNPKS